MAKVSRMTDGLKRRPTYEEAVDYIENDKDKIEYPDRTAKELRNTFELSQLDGWVCDSWNNSNSKKSKNERKKVY